MTHILSLVCLLAIQQPVAESASLSGTVVDSISGKPLGKVVLTLSAFRNSAPTPTTSSDSNGHFTLVDLEPGDYHLTGKRIGYLETAYGARRPGGDGTAIHLEADQSLKELEVKLVPAGVISGAVRDADGETLADASVVILRETYRYGTRNVEAYDSQTTNGAGEYAFGGLKPGSYYIGAEPRSEGKSIDHTPAANRVTDAVVRTLYPNAPDIRRAAPVHVAPGSRVTGIDVNLMRTRVFRVLGRMVDGGEAYIELIDGTGGNVLWDHQIATTTKNAEGDFELNGVQPGSYLLRAEGRDSKRGYTTVEVGTADVKDLRVTTLPPAEVKGHITVEGDKKLRIAGTNIFFTTDGRHGQSCTASSDQTFAVTRLDPGRYTIQVRGPATQDSYVKSIRSGETDVLSEGITITQSGAPPTEILLATDGGQVQGAVFDEDEHAVPGATVVLVPDSRHRGRIDLFKTVTADQSGRYDFKNLPPGEYKIFAWDDVEPGRWLDPDFLKLYESLGESVTVGSDGHETVKLRLLPKSH